MKENPNFNLFVQYFPDHSATKISGSAGDDYCFVGHFVKLRKFLKNYLPKIKRFHLITNILLNKSGKNLLRKLNYTLRRIKK